MFGAPGWVESSWSFNVFFTFDSTNFIDSFSLVFFSWDFNRCYHVYTALMLFQFHRKLFSIRRHQKLTNSVKSGPAGVSPCFSVFPLAHGPVESCLLPQIELELTEIYGKRTERGRQNTGQWYPKPLIKGLSIEVLRLTFSFFLRCTSQAVKVLKMYGWTEPLQTRVEDDFGWKVAIGP